MEKEDGESNSHSSNRSREQRSKIVVWLLYLKSVSYVNSLITMQEFGGCDYEKDVLNVLFKNNIMSSVLSNGNIVHSIHICKRSYSVQHACTLIIIYFTSDDIYYNNYSLIIIINSLFHRQIIILI